ncbi:restriction endonuclease subunit S [Neorhodopirellula lusitana]|uniref:restriction endonuclease subunit S n=1 Tax=Neorhodopirellula lusitana TaxID=445327 RepID=UPI00385075D8
MKTGIDSFVSSDWPIVTLNDLKSSDKHAFVGGPFGSNLTSKDYVSKPGVPVIRGTNLGGKASRFIDRDFAYVSEMKADSLSQNTAHPGDVVFTQRGTLGQVALIPENPNHSRYVISQSQMKLTVDRKKACPRFIYHYYRTPLAIEVLKSRTQATGVPHINLGILKEFPIPLPPLPEQRRIAGILDAADTIRRKRQQAIALTEQFLRSTFLDMFGQTIASVDLIGCPEGWSDETIEGIKSDKPRSCIGGPFGSDLGRSDYVEEPGVPVIRGGNLSTDSAYMSEVDFVYVSEEKGKQLEKNAAYPGDILVSQRGAKLAGQVAMIASDSKFKTYIVSQSQMKVTVDETRLDPIYLVYFMRSSHAVRLMERRTISTGVPHINLGILKSFPVVVPPLKLQQKFSSIRKSQDKMLKRLTKAFDSSDNLFNSLVQRAFRGEL